MPVADTTDQGAAVAQRRTLRRHRTFATTLLVVMGAIYLAATWSGETGFWIDLLRAGTEAALVGGLADWFAVTALFRHPLGLPIPRSEEHTSELQSLMRISYAVFCLQKKK